MTGIAGFFYRKGQPPIQQDSKLLLDAMAYRGDAKIVVGRYVCLGQTSKHGSMPLQRHHYTIALDGFLVNRVELVKKLSLASNSTDSEIIIAALIRWSDEFVSYLRGDFAFVIADTQKKRLLCVRDPMGVKPFYYYESGKVFAFASEARPLGRHPLFDCSISEQRIADSLVFPLEHADKTSTLFQSVKRLPPASLMIVDEQHVQIKNYWQPNPEFELKLSSDEEYVEAFSEQLERAVATRMPRSGNIGVLLSGGVDSSVVTGVTQALVAKQKHGSLVTYSTILEPEQKCKESTCIRLMQKKLGLNSVTVRPSDLPSIKQELAQIMSLAAEPFDWCMWQVLLLANQAVQGRCEVLFDGVDGDLIHSLSPSYPSQLLRDGKLREALREEYLLWDRYYDRNENIASRYYWLFRHLGLPQSLAWLKHFKPAPRADIGHLIHPELGKLMSVEARVLAMHNEIYGQGLQSLRSRHARSIVHPVIAAGLERYDRVTALAGIEVRHPLMDQTLVELSLAFPREQKVRDGWSKFHLRRAGMKTIPKQISFRKDHEENAWRFFDDLVDIFELREQVQNANNIDQYLRPGVKKNIGKLVAGDVIQLYYLSQSLRD